MTTHIGFLINPIAGMGGRVGLKGTDGVAAEAVRLGAVPIANLRAIEMLGTFKRLLDQETRPPDIRWLTCPNVMGADALRRAGIERFDTVGAPDAASSARDTERAIRAFVAAKVDLVLFCGGDGTARDVCGVTGEATPVLGIPAGVKMYSGVFGVTPARTAEILLAICQKGNRCRAGRDRRSRRGHISSRRMGVRLYMSAQTPFEPTVCRPAKALLGRRRRRRVKRDISDAIARPDRGRAGRGFRSRAWKHGAGDRPALRIDKTLLGIDAVVGGRLVGQRPRRAADARPACRNIPTQAGLSPIGAQGFLLGRGNQQLSPAVVRAIGTGNLVIVATPAKLARTPLLRFDTGDPALDAELISRKYYAGDRRLSSHANGENGRLTRSGLKTARSVARSRQKGAGMTYVPHTDRERTDMLAAIGINHVDDLFADIPAAARFPALKLPPPCSEFELEQGWHALAARNAGCQPDIVLPWRRHLPPLRPATVDYVLSARRVLHLLHAVPARGQPGHAAGLVRVPEHDLPAHRHGCEQRQPLRRRDRARRGGDDRAQCRPGQAQQDHRVARSSIRSIAPWCAPICAERNSDDHRRRRRARRFRMTWSPARSTTTAALVIQNPNFFGQCEPTAGLAEAVHRAGALLSS